MTPSPRVNPTARPDSSGPSSVRLEVRLGSGRPVAHPMSGTEFRFGSAPDCDVRLPGGQVPAVVCRLLRTPDRLTLVRTDPAFPVLVNHVPVTTTDPVPLANGDRLALGSVDVTVSLASAYIRPRLVTISPVSVPVSPATPTPARDPLADERAALAALRTQLETQARELEADRIQWYRRRAELEAECREAAVAEPPAPDPREEEFTRLQQALEAQYTERREQLTQMQEMLRRANEALAERQRQFEADLARRSQDLDEREQQIAIQSRVDLVAREADLARREEELTRTRDQYAADVVRRDRLQSSLDERERQLDRRAVEIDDRMAQLHRDTVELEDQVRLAGAEQDRLVAETARLDRQRQDQEAHADQLAERSARLEAQQAMLAILRARLDRQAEEARETAQHLAAERVRLDTTQRDLDERLREAERLRAELDLARADQLQQQQLTTERTALLDATLAEIQHQKDALTAHETRLTAREFELDQRSADIAEQTAVMKARLTQVLELQERLETDRVAVRDRAATLTDADLARQTFQEQLRRRAEELSIRSKQLDEATRQVADERATLAEAWASLQAQREQDQQSQTASQAELDHRTQTLADREAALTRQIERLQEAGRSVAKARKDLAQARAALAHERAELDQTRTQTQADLDALRRETPDLEDRARAAIERATAAREVLRGQVAEWNQYADQTRADLANRRAELHTEGDRLRDRERQLEQARAEHRLAVTEFRQQLLDWQSRVTELKQSLTQSESRFDARQADIAAAAKQADAAALDLARQAEELRRERQEVAMRRSEVERHLTDMREWYRTKLRELADQRQSPRGVMTRPQLHAESDEVEPGDRQLGELLQSLELIDAETLAALWTEASHQHRTLRQVLLASGVITLYQLALIEAGNLDGLMLGRLRVVDRIRVSARESVYRVHDPSRGDDRRGLYQLRHLAESEMEDAVRPDEFRQRFSAACAAAHPNLVNTLEVLEIQGRPAALQECITGTPSADWTAEAATPGVWVRLISEAAAALDALHRAGLTHGALTSDSFWLTPEGTVKLNGVGEPLWLRPGASSSPETSPEADLRDLGQIAYGWSQLASSGKKRGRGKSFPDSLTAVIRRLESDPETPMADTATGTPPYRSTAELLADLRRLAGLFPCPQDTWDALVSQSSTTGDEPSRQSA